MNRTLLAVALAIILAPSGCVARPSGDTPAPAPPPAPTPAGPAAAPSAENVYRKPADEELRSRLSRWQYEVTQHEATEPPFENEYWNNHEEGLYVDIASGEPLFTSRDKFDSGTGWPSFTQPIEPGRVVTKTDSTFGMVRNEVRSKDGDSHLGHVFDDGPEPTGLRYCINSASLRFIPVARLEAEGYGRYRALFDKRPAHAP